MHFFIQFLFWIFIIFIVIGITILILPFYLLWFFIQFVIVSLMRLFGKNTYSYHYYNPRFVFRAFHSSYDNDRKNEQSYKVIDMEEDS